MASQLIPSLSTSTSAQSKNLFQSCEENNVDDLLYILSNGTSPNERDDFGRTSLHICCTFGSSECVAILLKYHADFSLQDHENGWTPLHRSLYFGFIKITFLLLKAGAQLTRPSISVAPLSSPLSSLNMERSLRNTSNWISPLDHEGNSPLDLLSSINHRKRSSGRIEDATQYCTEVLTFGKADFYLGIPLPRSSLNVTKPRPILDLETEHIVNVTASKFHSAALTSDGRVYTWGIGKAGRLGQGNELNLPSPTLIQSFGKIFVTQIASSDNHMLAIDRHGTLYSWGSNRFGQLGRGPYESTAKQNTLAPGKVEKLKKDIVCGIAAGETHSVCFTSVGEVWTWGSNSHGQLGVRLFHTENKLGNQSTSTPVKVKLLGTNFPNQMTTKETKFDSRSFQDDEELWTNDLLEQPTVTPFTNCLKILQVCASRSCTVVILKRPRSIVSEVYQWGYGSHSPTKLQFFRPLCNHTLRVGGIWNETQAPADITQIAAGYNHFVGIDSLTGYVYTWGFGAVQLGHGTAETATHLSVPLLLESMMPERGGGSAVYVSAAGDRTCIVTKTGDLYSWGFTDNMGTLGHGEGKYQPLPKPVEGIKGAVKVACGVDHTIVLIAACIPALPHFEASLMLDLNLSSDEPDDPLSPAPPPLVVTTSRPLLTLKELCEQRVAQNVHLQNVISILNFASYYSCHGLYSFALQFILRNLDIVLIQLFNSFPSAGSTKVGRESVWSELDVVVNEIEESIASPFLESQSQVGSMGVEFSKPETSPKATLFHPSSPQLLAELPTDLSSCKKLIKNLRKHLAMVSGSDRSLISKKISALETQISSMKKAERRIDSVKPLPVVTEIEKVKDVEKDQEVEPKTCEPTLPPSTGKDEASVRKHHKVKYVSIEQFEKQKNHPAPHLSASPLGLIPTTAIIKPAWQSPHAQPTSSPLPTPSPSLLSKKELSRPSRSGSLDLQPSTPPLPLKAAPETRNRGNSLTLDSFIQHQTPKKRQQTRDPSVLGPTSPSSSLPKQKSDVNPWKTPEKLSSSRPSPQSSPSPGAITAAPTEAVIGAPRRSLHEIQQEEERVRKGSYLKTLRGNTTPWLMDHQSAQISSLEAVMNEERERLLEQQELEEALAAVARLEEKEKEANAKRNQRGSGGQRKSHERKNGVTSSGSSSSKKTNK